MAITGAILGDIIGSQFEFDRPDSLDWKNCNLFTNEATFTDDTVLTLAIKKAVLKKEILSCNDIINEITAIGKRYVNLGYGSSFYNWLMSENHKPYNSYGNGSAMRVSFIGEYYDDLTDVIHYAIKSAKITHNHPEGIKGAVVTAKCIWMAKNGYSKEDIYNYVLEEYPGNEYAYPISISLDELRNNYQWSETCPNSVPVAMRCFYESNDWLSFIRNVISLKCDADTLGAIGGGVAEEFYKIDVNEVAKIIKKNLTPDLYEIYKM